MSFFPVQFANLEFPSFAVMSAFDVSELNTGSIAYVDSVKAYFSLDKGSALTLKPASILVATTGRWIRESYAHPFWAVQTTWFIAPVTGSDEAAGGVGTPLKTWGELERRLGPKPWYPQHNVVVAFVESHVDGTDPVDVNVAPVGGFSFLVQSATTVAHAGTFSGVAARNRTAGTMWQVTDAALAGANDWAPQVNRLLVNTTRNTACWVQADLGAKTAAVSESITTPATGLVVGYPYAYADHQVGDAYQVLVLRDVAVSSVVCAPAFVSPGGTTVDGGGVTLNQVCMYRVHCLTPTAFDDLYVEQHSAFGPLMQECSFDPAVFVVRSEYTIFSNCNFIAGITWQGYTGILSGLAQLDIVGNGGGFVDGDVVFTGSGLTVGPGSYMSVGLASFQGVANAIALAEESSVEVALFNYASASVWGNPTTLITMEPEGRLLYTGGTAVGMFPATGAILIDGSATAQPYDATTGAYATTRALTQANLDAAIGAGGFGGSAHRPNIDAHFILRGS